MISQGIHKCGVNYYGRMRAESWARWQARLTCRRLQRTSSIRRTWTPGGSLCIGGQPFCQGCNADSNQSIRWEKRTINSVDVTICENKFRSLQGENKFRIFKFCSWRIRLEDKPLFHISEGMLLDCFRSSIYHGCD